MTRAALVLLVSVLLACIAPRHASAHARAPYVEHIAFDPHDPSRIVLQFSFGLAVTEDGGESWRWVCAEAYGADATWEDPDIAIADDGSVVIGTYETAMRGARDLCAFDRPGGSIDDTGVLDLAQDPRDANVVWAVTSRGGGEPDRVQRTTDGGQSWALVGDGIEALLESIALAPSDASRIYLTAMMPATADTLRRALVLRSDDAGAHFTSVEIEILDGEQMPILVGVDPTNADRLFVRMRKSELERGVERLLVSEDGGATFRSILELHQIRGFAISDDGQTIWAGSSQGDGLWIAEGGTLTFTQIGTLDVRCLVTRGDELWACVDQLSSRFALGRSTDGGRSFDELFFLDELGLLPDCPTCSATGAICPMWIDDLQFDWQRYFAVDAGWMPIDAQFPLECVDSGVTMIDAGPQHMDGGIAIDAGLVMPPPDGCGCRVARARSSGSIAMVAGLIAFATRRHRRRARR